MTDVYRPPKQNRNKPIEDVNLTDVLVELARKINLALNCHAIGQIQSFDPATQTCSVSINYQKTFITRNENGTYSEKKENYPILASVPIVILSGGSANLTFPIQKGDDCLLLFNDRDMDNWITSGQVLPPNTARLHDLNDAIALVGIRPVTKTISGYDSSRAILKNGNASVGVSTSKIQIQNNSYNLKTELTDLCTKLNSLCTAIQGITVLCSAPGNPSGPPLNASAIASVASDISAISTNIAGLLE